jgi:cofilin
VEVFQDFKLKKAYRFIIFKLSDDFKSVGVDETSEKGTYEDFVKALPKDGCRYAVFDFEYTTNDGPRNKLLFFTW